MVVVETVAVRTEGDEENAQEPEYRRCGILEEIALIARGSPCYGPGMTFVRSASTDEEREC